MEITQTEFEDKVHALQECSYFSELSTEILDELAQGTRLTRYERGEIIVWQDEPSAGLFILYRGSVKLFKLSPQGRELIVNIFREGDSFNEVPVFDGGPNPVNVAALEECALWLIDSDIIRKAMARHPEMSQAVVLNLSKNLRKLVHVIEELSFYQVTNRLARLISQLPEEQLSGEAGVRLTQDQIAARLGTVREVVARSLRELERCGAIRVERRQISILDKELLHELAQTPLN